MISNKYRPSDRHKKIHEELKAIKYPVPPISYAMHISKRKNQLAPKVKSKLDKALDPKLNAFRRVRGDGNCFFRAFAFSYITNCRHWRWESVFSHLKEVSMETCHEKSIPKEFQPYYKDALLKDILKDYW